MRRSLAAATLVLIIAPSPGCGMAKPRNFRKIEHPAPMVRARALSLGDRRPGAQVVPALVARLDDPDPVVRLAAHEELKKRTGQDFGYVPWEEGPERQAAVARWRGWMSGDSPVASPQQATAAAPAAAPSPQHQPTTRIRRTIRH
ncbi:HEAT repeat domain-containing protein [Paludisphaera soli]|uniref:HEAT repeat domain-containing protein n=1 Tax=Paludisphaera soli TaxID=2712865 RepID=UPI0013EC2E6D|nr:HEAT repeat domain-containing protein [Paludisphaera soli]